jgi:hypothetical protein
MDKHLQRIKELLAEAEPNSTVVEFRRDEDEESYLLWERSGEEILDYDAGFTAGQEGRNRDATRSFAWRRGWADAQELPDDREINL